MSVPLFEKEGLGEIFYEYLDSSLWKKIPLTPVFKGRDFGSSERQ
jgi:hypothetical protein